MSIGCYRRSEKAAGYGPCFTWGRNDIGEDNGKQQAARRPPAAEDVPFLHLLGASKPVDLPTSPESSPEVSQREATAQGRLQEKLSVGVRRDRSEQYLQIRSLMQSNGPVGLPMRGHVLPRPQQGRREPPRGDSKEANASMAEQNVRAATMSMIHEEASYLIASLLSKLAQHNGLRQFGVEFSDRVPPFEQRMLVPTLEASIEDGINRIDALYTRVELMEFPAGSSCERVCENLRAYLAKAHKEAQASFESQRKHLQEQARASPLHSPILSPQLSARLAQAMKSPTPSACNSPPQPSTIAPSSSESASRKPTLFDIGLSGDEDDDDGFHDDFSLDGWDDPGSPNKSEVHAPFAGVFS